MKPGWTDTSNGCDGTFGGATSHECALPTPGNLFSSDVYINHTQKYKMTSCIVSNYCNAFSFQLTVMTSVADLTAAPTTTTTITRTSTTTTVPTTTEASIIGNLKFWLKYSRTKFSFHYVTDFEFPAFHLFLFLDSTKYVLGEKGAKLCKTGSIISDPSECESACGDLKLQKGTLWNAGVCFDRNNGKCGMNAKDKLGANSPLICKISGN